MIGGYGQYLQRLQQSGQSFARQLHRMVLAQRLLWYAVGAPDELFVGGGCQNWAGGQFCKCDRADRDLPRKDSLDRRIIPVDDFRNVK